jgi:zinc/manganese transport system substrate-binding protein
MRTILAAAVAVVALGALLAGCGDDDAVGEGPRIVVTTGILGDVVSNLVGDAADVEVIMPPNADPHDFAPSAKQAVALREADVVVANGLGFEAGLGDAVDAAEADGATVLTITDYVDTLPFDGPGDHGDDPHVFTDPARMVVIARSLADDLAEAVPELAQPAVRARADDYVETLDDLDREIGGVIDAIPAARRVLVTNHEVFGYFADRYGFEVLGAVVPGGSTLAEPSAADLAELAGLIDERDVPAIFVETSASRRLAEALAAEGADVAIVELYSESLGEPGSDGATYVAMMRTNANRIADALTET